MTNKEIKEKFEQAYRQMDIQMDFLTSLKLWLAWTHAEDLFDDSTKDIAWAIVDGTLPNMKDDTLYDIIEDIQDNIMNPAQLTEEYIHFYKNPPIYYDGDNNNKR